MNNALGSAPAVRLPWAWLGFGSALQTLLLAILFTVPFHHLWSVMPTPPPETGTPGGTGTWLEALAIAVVFGVPTLVPFALFVRRPGAWLPASLPPLVLAAAVGVVLLPALVSLVTYPCCVTSDVMDYVNRQRLWAVYGGNPFFVVPNDHPQDWSYYLSNFRDGVFSYGPLWWVIGRAFTQWATDLGQYLVGLKILAAVAFAVSVRLVWLLSAPERRLQNLVFFAWNPVVLVDGLIRLHNDLLTLPFLLAALWLWPRPGQQTGGQQTGGQQTRAAWSLPMVALAALVKLIVAPAALVLLALLWKARDWRAIAVGGLASLVAAVALYAPFWSGLSTLTPLIAQANRAQWSVGAVLLYGARPLLGDGSVLPVRLVLLAAGVVLIGLCVKQLLMEQTRSVATVASYATLVLLVGMLSTPLSFYSHYLTPVIGLAALAADRRVRSLVLVLSFGTMVDALMGVDQFSGGLSGALMDAVGCVVLLLALGLGLLRGWRLGVGSAAHAAA